MTTARSIEVQSIATVSRIRVGHNAYDWSFPHDFRSEIENHWDVQRRSKPALFKGRVLLTRDIAVGDNQLTGSAFTTTYDNFLSWRDFGHPGDANVSNLFAMAALESSDGAFLLGSMAAGTAAAGRLYFPAGTPEPKDLGSDGFIDFDDNILRELAEETGLPAARITLEPTWTVVFAGPHVACFKTARLNNTAKEIMSEVDAFIDREDDPELDGIYPVRGLDDLDERRMHPFMLGYLREKLATRR